MAIAAAQIFRHLHLAPKFRVIGRDAKTALRRFAEIDGVPFVRVEAGERFFGQDDPTELPIFRSFSSNTMKPL